MKTASFIFALIIAAALAPTSDLFAAVPGGDALAGLILKEFDTSSDGNLDQGEWQAGIASSFTNLDSGGDGSISGSEIDALHSELAGETGDLTAGLLVALIKQVLFTLDTNKDMLIDRQEYGKLADGIFDRLDGDKNKSLTKGELAELPVKLMVK